MGILDGLKPKVVVVLIGTNNLGHNPSEKPEWVAAGITAIVNTLHQKLPDTKVLLLGIFPRGGIRSRNMPIRSRIAAVNAIVSKLDDGNKTRYLDMAPKFLGVNGDIPKDVLGDGLHPTPKGDQIWAETTQPLLDEMMGASNGAPQGLSH